MRLHPTSWVLCICMCFYSLLWFMLSCGTELLLLAAVSEAGTIKLLPF